MPDPERMLRGMAAQHPIERALLSELWLVSVPSQAKGRVWAALTASIPCAIGPQPSVLSAASNSAA